MKFGDIFVMISAFGGKAVINRIEPDSNTDDNGGNGKRVKERRQERGDEAEKERQQSFRTKAQQDLCEYEQQQIPHEVNSSHHKDE